MSGRKVVVLFIIWMSFLSFFACQPLPPSDKLQATPTSFEVPPTFPPPATIDSSELEIEKRDLSSRLTDLLIGVSANYPQFCDQPERNQIWLLPSNADEEKVLLADDGIDYNYPQWMPSGNRFLYVESIPVTTSASGAEVGSTGMDSIWMADADGSNRQRLSDYYPRSNHWTPNSSVCLRDTFISGPLVISPDGKYVAFVHITENPQTYFYNYYILNISTGETTLLYTMQDFSIPVWYQRSSRLIIIDDKEALVRVFDTPSSDEVVFSEYKYPTEVLEPNEGYTVRYGARGGLFYSVPVDKDRLVSSFSAIYSLHSYFDALWYLDLRDGNWHNEEVELESIWSGPLLGETVNVACHYQGIYFIDPSNWLLQDLYSIEYSPGGGCRDLAIIKTGGGG